MIQKPPHNPSILYPASPKCPATGESASAMQAEAKED